MIPLPSIPRGILKVLILKLLSEKPMHGYEIMEYLEKKLKWRPSAGSIYPKLQEMEFEGLIEVSEEKVGGKIKKVYSLTERGKKEFEKYKETKKEINEFASNWIEKFSNILACCYPIKGELSKVFVEIGKMKSELLKLSAKKAKEALKIIEQARKKIEKISEKK